MADGTYERYPCELKFCRASELMLSDYADWINMMALMKSEFLGRAGATGAILRAAGIDDDADTLLILWELNNELESIHNEEREAQQKAANDPRRLFSR